jgi:tRNA G18 (ribose-2'-O)-methylase SpoU
MLRPDLLYGLHPVATALACGRRLVRASVALSDPTDARRSTLHALLVPWVTSLARAQPGAPARVIRAERGHLDSLTRNAVHQGLVAEFEPLPALPELPYGAPPSALQLQPPPPPPAAAAPAAAWPLLVTVDGVTDPQNLGAVLRSALLLGADGIALARGSSGPPLNGTVAKASAGALDVWRASGRLYTCGGGFSTWLRGAAEAGWMVLGASAAATGGGGGGGGATALPFASLARTGPTVLVLGAEGRGLRASVLAACTHTVSIDLSRGLVDAAARSGGAQCPVGLVESLNVSVAAALLLSKLRQDQ